MVEPNTVGFIAPPDFPAEAYNRVNLCLRKNYKEPHQIQWTLRGLGWNGLRYRYRAMAEYDKEFTNSVRISDSPPAEERYKQEKALFGFFTNAVSVIDCFFFSAYCIASISKPEEFPVSTSEKLRFYPPKVRNKFIESFPSEKITNVMKKVAREPTYTKLKDMRDVLAHRGAPPRLIDERAERDGIVTIPSNPKFPSNQWQFDFSIDIHTTASLRQWLSQTLKELVESLDEFCSLQL